MEDGPFILQDAAGILSDRGRQRTDEISIKSCEILSYGIRKIEQKKRLHHFDYVVCRRSTLEPLLAVELDDPRGPRKSSTADDVKSTAARNAGFPIDRFSAGSNLTPQLVRQKLIAQYRLAKAGPLPEGMG